MAAKNQRGFESSDKKTFAMKIRLILFLSLPVPFSQAAKLTVGAGPFDRSQTVVTVAAPASLPENPALKSEDERYLPLQLADDGTVSFILPKLAADTSITFDLVSLPGGADGIAEATEEDGSVDFSVAGKPVTSYIGKGSLPGPDIDPVYLRAGYLHPLVTPGGNVVTNDYPEQHLHHHGIWMAWTKTVFDGRETDFWNMAKRQGTVESEAIDHVWSGPVHAGLEAVHRHIDMSSGEPVAALHELWVVKVFAIQEVEDPYFLIELLSEQRMAGNGSLSLPEYHYGGLGIRGLGKWEGAGNAIFLTSEGVTDRVEANSRPVNWIHIGGEVEGGRAGLGIFGHPRNFRSPQPIRVHPIEPFLCFAPQVAGDMEIAHDRVYRSSYRFVVADGPVDKGLMEKVWADYAHPPVAIWE